LTQVGTVYAMSAYHHLRCEFKSRRYTRYNIIW